MKVGVIPGLYFKSYSRFTESRIPFEALALSGVVESISNCTCQMVDFNIKGDDVTFENSGISFPNLTLDRFFYDKAAQVLSSFDIAVYIFTISIHTNGNFYHAVKIAQKLRQQHPECILIFTGLGPSGRHVDLLTAYPHIDIVVRGEAEATVTDLLQRFVAIEPSLLSRHVLSTLLPEIHGITYANEKGEIIVNPERALIQHLDSLPFPSLRFYGEIIRRVCQETKDIKYLSVEEHIHVEAGRGCPFRCTFCSNEHLWRRRYRLKSPDRLIEEIRVYAEEYGGKKFLFHQQLFTANKKKTRDFCEALIASGLKIEWSCFTRNDCVDGDLLTLMKASGCNTVLYGIESGSQSIQDLVKKKTKLDEVKQQIQLTIDHGVKPQLSYIIGFPEETPEDIQKTIDMYFEYKFAEDVESQIGLLAPTGGTEVLEQNIDELDFDGVSTTTWYTRFFDEDAYSEIEAHPLVFPQNHFIKTSLLTRDELRFIKTADIAASYLTKSFRYIVLNKLSDFPFETYKLYRQWRNQYSQEHYNAKHWDGILQWNTDISSIIVEFAQFFSEVLAQGDENIHLLQSLVSYELHLALMHCKMRDNNYEQICISTPYEEKDNSIIDPIVGCTIVCDYDIDNLFSYIDNWKCENTSPPSPCQTTYTFRASDSTHLEITTASSSQTLRRGYSLYRQVEF